MQYRAAYGIFFITTKGPPIAQYCSKLDFYLQPKELMSGMEDIPKAHEKSSRIWVSNYKFEIAALFPDRKLDRSEVGKS